MKAGTRCAFRLIQSQQIRGTGGLQRERNHTGRMNRPREDKPRHRTRHDKLAAFSSTRFISPLSADTALCNSQKQSLLQPRRRLDLKLRQRQQRIGLQNWRSCSAGTLPRGEA